MGKKQLFLSVFLASLIFSKCQQETGDPLDAFLITYLLDTAPTLYIEERGNPNGTPVIIVHGGPGLDFRYMASAFETHMGDDYRLIFYDQRATGRSAGLVDSTSINVSNFVRDLDSVRAAKGLDKVNLIGHSWGGLLAMYYGIQFPDRIGSLVLASSAGPDFTYYQGFLGNLLGAGIDVDTFSEKQATLAGTGTLEAFKDYYSYLFEYYFDDAADLSKLDLNTQRRTAQHTIPVANFIDANLFTERDPNNPLMPTDGFDIKDDLSAITAATLVIHCTTDVIPQANMTPVADGSLLPDATVTDETGLAGCGHFPFLETPGNFFGPIDTFYQGL